MKNRTHEHLTEPMMLTNNKNVATMRARSTWRDYRHAGAEKRTAATCFDRGLTRSATRGLRGATGIGEPGDKSGLAVTG